MDNNIIFKGEVKRAAGETIKHSNIGGVSDDEGVGACSECILYTRNESTLKVIERYDKHVMNGEIGGSEKNLGQEYQMFNNDVSGFDDGLKVSL